jgi:phosphoadenosine phosphosulfate reductase
MISEALKEKINHSHEVLRLAAAMSAKYYKKPMIITYSGGKDSDVLLHLALECLKPDEFEVLNSHTTVDAPQTVYHIREVFKDLEARGVRATVKYPMLNGKRVTMWDLIELKTVPPTRLMRYCCQILKEQSTPNRMVATGVRKDESRQRSQQNEFQIRERERGTKRGAIYVRSCQRSL